jgi:hypothetical protein
LHLNPPTAEEEFEIYLLNLTYTTPLTPHDIEKLKEGSWVCREVRHDLMKFHRIASSKTGGFKEGEKKLSDEYEVRVSIDV